MRHYRAAAPGRPEERLKWQVLSWARFNGLLAYHIPNHGYMNRRTGRYNQVDPWHVPGIPDLEIILPGGVTVRIELKRPDGKGKITPDQAGMIARLNALGHPAFVATSVQQIETYFRERGYIPVPRIPNPQPKETT